MKTAALISFAGVVLAVTCSSSPAQITSYGAESSQAFNAIKDPSEIGVAPRPEIQGRNRSQLLQRILGLSNEQTFKIECIIVKEAADCQAMASPHSLPVAAIRRRARDDIRALLTDKQRAVFNLVPASHGGGLIGRSPWQQLDRLDEIVHLAPAQKEPILDELIDRSEYLMESRGSEQSRQWNEIHPIPMAEIRAMLTPVQQQLLDAALAKHRHKDNLPGAS